MHGHLFVQANSNLAKEAATLASGQGCLLATGNFEDGIKECYLILEKKILCKIEKITEALIILLIE